jgi:NAD(P)-dependent dehydrogenase (short-subunit alcohol dehydrogenase family)
MSDLTESGKDAQNNRGCPMDQGNKVMVQAVVTGANRGIGLEFCRQLLGRGDRVIAACRKPGRALDVNRLAFEHPGHLHVLPLDLVKGASVAEFARETGTLAESVDLLINNAGVSPNGEQFGALKQEDLVEAFGTNAAGPMLLTQALAPLLERAPGARVMNVSSNLGSLALCDEFYTPSYCISKAALSMVTRMSALALSPRGVVCFAVNPGWVKTDMGGPRAPLPVEESVASLLALIDRADPSFAGRFVERDGGEVPW